jgi:hypothetical protein
MECFGRDRPVPLIKTCEDGNQARDLSTRADDQCSIDKSSLRLRLGWLTRLSKKHALADTAHTPYGDSVADSLCPKKISFVQKMPIDRIAWLVSIFGGDLESLEPW